MVNAVANRRSMKDKPWWGPLPPARSSPTMSLGDIWVTDSRSGGSGPSWRLSDFSGLHRSSESVRLSAVEKTMSQSQDSDVDDLSGMWWEDGEKMNDACPRPRRLTLVSLGPHKAVMACSIQIHNQR